MPENTFIVPLVHEDYVGEMLHSLEKNAGHEYQLFIIDQIPGGMKNKIDCDLYIQPKRNLGFAKAMNTGIKLAKTEYITYINDDIVFLDPRWWKGIKDTFGKAPNMLAVNPMSPKEPGWGYGKNTPDWGEREGDFVYPKAKRMRSPEEVDYDWLIKEYKKGWIDGLAGWCVSLRRDRLEEFFDKEGEMNPYRLVFDERFYPGSGEDYDFCHRGYGKGYKMVATTFSWVWHYWGQSLKHISLHPELIDDSRRWNKLNLLYDEDEKEGWRSPIMGRHHKRVGIVEQVDF